MTDSKEYMNYPRLVMVMMQRKTYMESHLVVVQVSIRVLKLQQETL